MRDGRGMRSARLAATFVASLAVSAAGSGQASGAARVVLVEEFMTTWCPYTPPVSTELINIADAQPTRFVFFQVHGIDESPSYQIPWGAIRAEYYGGTPCPTTVQDGILKRLGAYPTGTYTTDFNGRVNVPTDVAIHVGGSAIGEQSYRFAVWLTLGSGGGAKTVRLYVVQVLDHYPLGSPVYRYCLRQVAMNGTSYYRDVALQPGRTTVVLAEMTFTGDDWLNRENMGIVAWVQKTGAFPANSEVYNATVMRWPFIMDCNTNGVPDDEDIASGTSQDCNANGTPDECDIRDCTGNPACGDCNQNGIPDACEGFDLADCDGDGLADQCELESGLATDCNGNGLIDVCDLASGASPDCNDNGIPDECDRANCTGEPWCSDCNHNGRIDACDLHVHVRGSSGRFSPFGTPTTAVYTLVNPPNALQDVTLSFLAFADINYSNEYVTVKVNGTVVGTIYSAGGEVDCSPTAAALVVPAATFNSLKAAGGGTVNIQMVPTTSVNPAQCSPAPTWIEAGIDYLGVPWSADANQNGIPDECEVPGVCRGDCDCDGRVGFSDIDFFVAGIPDDEAAWRQLYRDRYNGLEPACTFENCDVTADGHVDFADIDPFVALIPSSCP